jgi:two-component system sensor histidine kinase/response regulator
VLVVDDNASARLVLTEMLHGLGFQAEAVDGGAAALEVLERAEQEATPFEVLMLDLRMPGMDGLEVARRVRQMPLLRQPMLVLVTGLGRDEVMAAESAAEIDAVLLKPVNPSQLLDRLQTMLGSGPSAVAADGLGAEPAPTPADPSVTPAQVLRRAGTARGRILAVDDNEVNLQIARELLRGQGFEVDVAQDGQQALELVGRQTYHLVLMDMQMPVMDGLTATRAMRQLPRCARLPIVAMTANAMEKDRQDCLQAGMNDFLTKPIDPARLAAVVQYWVMPVSDQAADLGSWPAVAARLRQLLKEGDPDVIDWAAAQEPLVRQVLGGAVAEAFKDSLRRFDFDEALGLLQDTGPRPVP